jgi:hypothetical protein
MPAVSLPERFGCEILRIDSSRAHRRAGELGPLRRRAPQMQVARAHNSHTKSFGARWNSKWLAVQFTDSANQ